MGCINLLCYVSIYSSMNDVLSTIPMYQNLGEIWEHVVAIVRVHVLLERDHGGLGPGSQKDGGD